MIDLTKNQTFDTPLECWVRDYESNPWVKRELLSVDHRYGSGRSPYNSRQANHKFATLIDPDLPEAKKYSHDDLIMGASRKGWVFQDTTDNGILTYWSSKYKISRFRVAYKYNGPETVWYDMVAKDA